MKKIFQLFFVVGILISSFLLVQKIQKGNSVPCGKPMAYLIGTIDPRFNISKEDFSNAVSQAEKFWEDADGKNLLEQTSENPKFVINLVFDERQQQTIESVKIEDDLSDMKDYLDKVDNEYKSQILEYQKRLNIYQDKLTKYNNEVKKFQDEVANWNKKGGVSQDKYDDLKKEQKKLDDKYNSLEKERSDLNLLAQKIKKLAQKGNITADDYNKNVETYNNKFGNSREFEKGIFNGQEINIYQFNHTSDLKLVLIHELGHALGINHVDNSKSIMYYLMGEQDLDKPKATNEDLEALSNICK